MTWKTVDHYHLGYSLEKKQFYFYYRLEGDSSTSQISPTPAELVALADMFRNEGPISFNTDRRYFVTAAEEVGENEPEP